VEILVESPIRLAPRLFPKPLAAVVERFGTSKSIRGHGKAALARRKTESHIPLSALPWATKFDPHVTPVGYIGRQHLDSYGRSNARERRSARRARAADHALLVPSHSRAPLAPTAPVTSAVRS